MFHHPISTKDRNRLHQFSSKVLNGFWMCLESGERLDERQTRGRCERIEKQHYIRSLRQKIQRKRTENPLPCAHGSMKLAEDVIVISPNPRRLFSNVVKDISGCLLEEEYDGKAKRDSWSISGSFRNITCGPRSILSSSIKLHRCCSRHSNEFGHSTRAQTRRNDHYVDPGLDESHF